MRCGQQASQTARGYGRFIDSSIDSALINARCKNSKELTDAAESAHQAIPKIAIHPVGKTRGDPTERDNGVIIKFVDPHFICEKPKQPGLRVFQRVDLSWAISIWGTSVAIHPETKADTRTNKHERNEEHWLNQAPDLEVFRFAGEIPMQPWPRRREHNAETNCAKR